MRKKDSELRKDKLQGQEQELKQELKRMRAVERISLNTMKEINKSRTLKNSQPDAGET